MIDEFSVGRDADGRVVLRMDPLVADALRDLLLRWNEGLIAQGVNRDSGWAEVADLLGDEK